MRYTSILLDLDGTVLDSAPGITACLAYTFRRMGVPVPPPAELLAWVGPPIMDSFRDLAHFDATQAQRALDIYRERYLEVGALDATVYPGMRELLAAIHASPLRLSLATSKPETPATIMLRHFDLLRFFDVITGASDDEVRSAKEDVVAEALVRLRALGADLSAPVMIGDRATDVQGAAANGVPTIFVEWGYGAPDEAAGAIATAATAEDLRALLEL